jgi:hypothetical protein
MSSFSTPQREKKEDDWLSKAPKLNSSKSKMIADFMVRYAKFEDDKRTFNDVNPSFQRQPEVRFLDLINVKLKEQFLTSTLPRRLPILQKFYPVTREFFSVEERLTGQDKVIFEAASKRAEFLLNRVRHVS